MSDVANELSQRFPKMKPMKGSPSMFTINGFGTSLYGKRDFDPQTETYVATLCVVALFIPIMCLRSYRVAKAEQGWYFIGKEPLSTLARCFNLLVVALIATGFVLIQHNIRTSSPQYIAEQQMKSARQLIDSGQLASAATACQTLVTSSSFERENALAAMDDILDNRCAQAPLSESVGVYRVAVGLSRSEGWKEPADVADKGMKLVAARGDADPRSGIAVLDAIRPLVIDTRPNDAARLPLLRKWVAAEPDNLDAVVSLAAILDEQKKPDEARALLMPVRDKLGNGEGARVLGSILADDGDDDGAYALLEPYVTTRLAALHEAEETWDSTLESLWEREMDLLRSDKGPEDFYSRYNDATKEQKDAILQEYVNGRVKNDPEYAAAQQTLREQAKVVPVALDLGIIMLQRAQGDADPAARKKQLESAEKVFLAIGGVAGESDTYRVTLGQVKYWLGKQDEGRKLFEEFLASKNRDVASLLMTAARYRELGAHPDARKLSEEAYKSSTTNEQRYSAATMRALCRTDLDDEITWLEKSNASDPQIKAKISKAMGDKARSEGRDEDAVEQYNASLAAYAAMPRDSTTLNQSALAHYAIFQTTGDSQALQRCIDSFQQALELQPSDPILLYNAGALLLEGSLSEITGKKIDLRALKMTGNVGTLSALYNDPAGRDVVAQQVRDHPGIARGMSYMEKAAVLTPKDGKAFQYIAAIHGFTRDAAAMASDRSRLREAQMDSSDHLAMMKDYLAGVRDEQSLAEGKTGLDRAEKTAAALRPAGGATAAVAVSQLASGLQAIRLYTGKIDADRVVALVEEAYKLSPSAMTDGSRSPAYLGRAVAQIAAQDPAFAKHIKKYERSLGIAYLAVLAATEPGPFKQKMAAHPDFLRAVEITRQKTARLQNATAFDWALLSAVDAGEAGQIADIIRKDDRRRLENEIDMLLSPTSAGDAVDAYWITRIYDGAGDRKELQRVAAMGIPVPVQ